ncbi:MAG: hypothetical protein M3Z09_02415, partial [Acidobacteriota bacterium]|nr:hypothetical protein [Acidobacteriota bacterium]
MRLSFCLIFGLLFSGISPVTGSILYSVTDLGTLGGAYTYGAGINNAGQVTGSFGPSNYGAQAFLYTDGHGLSAIAGPYSAGYGINNAGQVTGYSTNGHAFLYSNGQTTDLTPSLKSAGSVGYGVNNAGQVTGAYYIDINPENGFLYSNGQITDLGGISPGFAINEAGQVTGYAYTALLRQAFLYSDGQMKSLGTLGGRQSEGYGINNAGQVTGIADTSNSREHAFLYSNGQMTDLDPSGNYYYSKGLAINSSGQVVGALRAPVGPTYDTRAFVYRSGQILDLNDVIDPRLGLTLARATAINDRGQIVANASYRAYI